MTHPFQFSKVGRFHKADGNTIFGWAFVSTIKGTPYFDLGDGTHSDHIPVDSILPVSKMFMRESGAGLHQHGATSKRGDDVVAEVLYAYPMIDDIMAGNGVTSEKQGLMIGWDTDDAELAARAIKGEDTGFSIGGVVTAWDIVDGDGNVVDSVTLSKASRFGASLTSFGKLAGDVSKEQLRRVFRDWALKEVSLVDFPMQEPALVGVVKGRRGTGARPSQQPRILKTRRVFDKNMSYVTSESDGHAHVVDLSCMDGNTGRTSWEKSSSDEYGHDHAFVRQSDGTIVVVANDGHDHTVNDAKPMTSSTGAQVIQASRGAGNLIGGAGARSVDTTKEHEMNEIDSLKSENTDLKGKLAKAQRLGLLTDKQRSYMKSIPEADHDGFLAKSSADRDMEVKAAEDRDPVRYTAKSGKVYRESQAELADMAKKLDESETEKVAQTEKAEEAAFGKAAIEKMAHFSKKADLHAKMLRALSKGLAKADYDAAVEVLEAADAVLAPNFEASEGGNGVESDDAETPAAAGAADPATAGTKPGAFNVTAARKQLDDMATKFATDNKLHKSIAKARLLKTDAAAKLLYDKIRKADVAAQRRN